MEAKCTRLEKELEERSVDKLDGEEEDNATSHQVGLVLMSAISIITMIVLYHQHHYAIMIIM